MGADNVVPLCGDVCHPAYDRHELDLLPYLTLPEQLAAVQQAGSIALAYRRTTNTRDF
jgi:hypothetical protein